MSKLLIDGRTVAFLPALAVALGEAKYNISDRKKPGRKRPKHIPGAFIEAILLQQIHYGLDQRYYTVFEGKKWMKLPYATFAYQTGATPTQLRRAMDVLIEIGVVEQYQLDMFSRVKPVRINYEHPLLKSAGSVEFDRGSAESDRGCVEFDRPTPIFLEEKEIKAEKEGDAPTGDAALALAELHISLCETSGLVVSSPRSPATLAAAIRSMPPDALADLEQALHWAKTERWWITQLCRQAAWSAKGGARYVELVNQYRAKGMNTGPARQFVNRFITPPSGSLYDPAELNLRADGSLIF